jgi:peptide deformylase
MKVITAPHPTLRKVANPVTKFDKRLVKFVERLKKQLLLEKEPEGVGLAAPQVNKSWQIFILRHLGQNLDNQENQDQEKEKKPNNQLDQLTAFINPKIIAHSTKKTLLKGAKDFEGCLSIPKIYGPVPRWDWVEVEYQTLNQKGEMEKRTEKYHDFLARVIQHEYDHLQGILFTDYLLDINLPAYIIENNQWVELEDREILASF